MNNDRPDPDMAWQRLAAAARREARAGAGSGAAEEAPPGFAVRVVALAGARAAAVSPGALFELFAIRALGAACACALAALVWASLPGTLEAQESDAVLAGEAYLDPVAQILEAVQSR